MMHPEDIEKIQRATNFDVANDPHKFGAPTFEEFKRNREKYMGRDDDTLESAEKGSQTLKKYVKRYLYEIEGYRCRTLDEVDRVATSQGIPIKDLDYRPTVVPLGGGKFDILVKFISKSDRERREEKV
jgi:hypothetical protein